MSNTFAHPKIVSESRLIPATAQQVFDLLADPSCHSLIDGSGSVKGSLSSDSSRLTLGSKFGMQMKIGVPYRIANEVVECDEPNLIAWRHIGGHIWRYRMKEVDGGCEVTEEFDWRGARSALALRVMRAPSRNRQSIRATLDRMAAHFAA
jgi:hypothetical protein